MPAGRASMQMTLASQGRSASALTGALSGSGTVTLESAAIAGLDPRAFEVAIRASDAGQATDDARLRQIVEPALSAGALLVASAQIPFTIRDGRLRVGATTLDADGARAIVSGGYDIPADQADIRAALASTGGRTGDQPSGNSDVRRGLARRARSHRRCGGAVVMAGGAGDRSRNPPAGFDRARRAAAGGVAGIDSAAAIAPPGRAPDAAPSGPTASGCAESRPRSAPVAAEAQGQPLPRPPAAAPPHANAARGQPAGRAAAAADRSPSGARRACGSRSRGRRWC